MMYPGAPQPPSASINFPPTSRARPPQVVQPSPALTQAIQSLAERLVAVSTRDTFTPIPSSAEAGIISLLREGSSGSAAQRNPALPPRMAPAPYGGASSPLPRCAMESRFTTQWKAPSPAANNVSYAPRHRHVEGQNRFTSHFNHAVGAERKLKFQNARTNDHNCTFRKDSKPLYRGAFSNFAKPRMDNPWDGRPTLATRKEGGFQRPVYPQPGTAAHSTPMTAFQNPPSRMPPAGAQANARGSPAGISEPVARGVPSPSSSEAIVPWSTQILPSFDEVVKRTSPARWSNSSPNFQEARLGPSNVWGPEAEEETFKDWTLDYQRDMDFHEPVSPIDHARTPRLEVEELQKGSCILCFAPATPCGRCAHNVCASCKGLHTCVSDLPSRFCPAHSSFPKIGLCRDHYFITVCKACCTPHLGLHADCSILKDRDFEGDEEQRRVVTSLVLWVIQDMEDKGVQAPIMFPIINLQAIFSTERPLQYYNVSIPQWTEFINLLNFFLFKYFYSEQVINFEKFAAELKKKWTQISPPAPEPTFACTFDTRSLDAPDIAKCSIHKLGSCTEAVLGIDGRIFVSILNGRGDPCDPRQHLLNVHVDKGIAGCKSKVAATMQAYGNNAVMVSYCLTEFRAHTISITVNGQELPGSPMEVFVRASHPFLWMKMEELREIHIPASVRLLQPYGICSHSSGVIYVADYTAGDIKVFNQDLEIEGIISSHGGDPGHLNHPTGITEDREGNIVVCDSGNYRLQVFSPIGELLRCSRPQDWRPHSVTAAADNLYAVGVDNGRVLVVTPDLEGTFLLHEPGRHQPTTDKPRAVRSGVLDDVFVVQDNATIHSACLGNARLTKFCTLARLRDMPSAEISDFIIDRHGFLVVAEASTECVSVHTTSGREVVQWTCEGRPLSVAEVRRFPNHFLVSVYTDDGGSLKLCGPVED